MQHMDRSIRLCLIHVDAPLREAFCALGCEVLSLAPEPGTVLHLPVELDARGFRPDIVLQQERLGRRLLVSGLGELDCLRLFWARDPHLNAFWQAAYARLFDLTFSTQRRNIPDLQALGAGQVLHLPWYAPQEPFTPFAERLREAGFVGRLGPSRPVRTWLVELLSETLPGRFEAVDNLDFAGMLAFYRATRLAPNESISGEINFRLFEAAACGCVVLGQDLGQEQAELFEPGRELLVCADALELVESVRMLSGRPRLAEALGRAAWERVQACHLPLARARSILEAAQGACRLGAEPDSDRRWLALAQARLLEAGRPVPGAGASGLPGDESLADTLRSLDAQTGPGGPGGSGGSGGPDELLLAARLRVAIARGQSAEADALLRRCQEAGGLGLPLALTCSLAALRLALGRGAEPSEDDLALAQTFAGAAGVRALSGWPTPSVALLMAWAGRLREVCGNCEDNGGGQDSGGGQPRRGGFSFDPERHLAANALECLYQASALAPGDLDVLRRLEAELAADTSSEVLRLGVLSELGLRAHGDWRVGLHTGLCDLQVFRPGPGLSELALAAQLAGEQGEAGSFALALAEADPSGRLRRALDSLKG
jgi:hypothetical protein